MRRHSLKTSQKCQKADKLSSAITVKGELELTPEGKQPFEIKARKIILEAVSDPDYPLQPKNATAWSSSVRSPISDRAATPSPQYSG